MMLARIEPPIGWPLPLNPRRNFAERERERERAILNRSISNGLFGFRKVQLTKPVVYPPGPELTEIKTERRAVVRLTSCMSNFVFKCPQTGMNVQHRQADEPVPGRCTYETVLCQACGRLHFINRSSHRLLGEKEQ